MVLFDGHAGLSRVYHGRCDCPDHSELQQRDNMVRRGYDHHVVPFNSYLWSVYHGHGACVSLFNHIHSFPLKLSGPRFEECV